MRKRFKQEEGADRVQAALGEHAGHLHRLASHGDDQAVVAALLAARKMLGVILRWSCQLELRTPTN